MASEKFDWYYVGSAGQVGPLSETQFLELVDQGIVLPTTLVWREGMSGWVPAESVPRVADRLRQSYFPPTAPPPVVTPPPPPAASGTSSTGLVCPRDGTRLKHQSRSGVDIDWCPDCKGVWLDRGELEKLVDRENDDDGDDDDRRRGRKRGFFTEVFDMFD